MFAVVEVPVESLIPLRASILRPGRPEQESVYPLDEHADSRHFGAFLDGTLVGSASLLHQSADCEQPPPRGCMDGPWIGLGAWRLRGMTVRLDWRGRGFGAMLFQACVNHVRSRGGSCLWFNARSTAIGFYRGLGCLPDEPHGTSAAAYVFMWKLVDRPPDPGVPWPSSR